MTIPTFHVDLDLPPEQRWSGIEAHNDAAGELLSYYVNDLGGLEQFDELLFVSLLLLSIPLPGRHGHHRPIDGLFRQQELGGGATTW